MILNASSSYLCFIDIQVHAPCNEEWWNAIDIGMAI